MLLSRRDLFLCLSFFFYKCLNVIAYSLTNNYPLHSSEAEQHLQPFSIFLSTSHCPAWAYSTQWIYQSFFTEKSCLLLSETWLMMHETELEHRNCAVKTTQQAERGLKSSARLVRIPSNTILIKAQYFDSLLNQIVN